MSYRLTITYGTIYLEFTVRLFYSFLSGSARLVLFRLGNPVDVLLSLSGDDDVKSLLPLGPYHSKKITEF